MVFKLAEVPREGNVLGARNVLVAEKQHLVLQQQRPNFSDQSGVARRDPEVHVRKLRTNRAGERLDLDRRLQHIGADDSRARLNDLRHDVVS